MGERDEDRPKGHFLSAPLTCIWEKETKEREKSAQSEEIEVLHTRVYRRERKEIHMYIGGRGKR